MYETTEELASLQRLLDSSHDGASEHLRGIINDERTLRAAELTGLLTGMHTLAAATVTRAGEPRVSALDGHFLHGRWTISTSASSPKGRHLHARPAISVACIEGEDLGVFTTATSRSSPNPTRPSRKPSRTGRRTTDRLRCRGATRS